MKQIIALASLLLAFSAGAINITNYPVVITFDASRWFFLTDPGAGTNYNLPGNYVAGTAVSNNFTATQTFSSGLTTGTGTNYGVDIDGTTGTVTATNGFVLPLNATPPLILVKVAQLFSDGTNLCIVLKNSAGTLSTNRVTMTAYP